LDVIKSAAILQWSLRAGALYFALIALVHTLGIKVPGLYIFFDLPSYVYQDHIIAFLAFGWAVLYFVASSEIGGSRLAVRGVLLASFVALCGLVGINGFDGVDLLSTGSSINYFWLQTLLLLGYVGWLLVFYLRSR